MDTRICAAASRVQTDMRLGLHALLDGPIQRDIETIASAVLECADERARLAKLIDCAWSAQCGQCLNAAHALLEG